MYYLEIALFVIGIVLVVVGYRKNGRNLLLAGAVVLYLSAALPQFVGGYLDGVSGSAGSETASR